MQANAQILKNDTTAARTRLTGTAGIDRHYFDPGLYSLVVKQVAEQSQANVMSGTGKMTVLKHKFERQIFQIRSRRRCQPVGGWSCATSQGADWQSAHAGEQPCFTALRQFLPPFFFRDTERCRHSQLFERCLQVLGTVEERTIRKRQSMRNTHIHPYGRVGGFLNHRFGKINLEQDVPARRLAKHNDVFEFSSRGVLDASEPGSVRHSECKGDGS